MRSLQAAGVCSALGATHQGPGGAGERGAGQARALVNALTIDVEEHFQVHNLDTIVHRTDWDRHPSLGRQNWPVAGGGYFRLYPLWLTRRAIRHLNVQGQRAVRDAFASHLRSSAEERLQAAGGR